MIKEFYLIMMKIYCVLFIKINDDTKLYKKIKIDILIKYIYIYNFK